MDHPPDASLLAGIAGALRLLLQPGDFDASMQGALAEIGRAARVDRVYIFECNTPEGGAMVWSQKYEWTADGIEPQIDNPALQNMCFAEICPRWQAELETGLPVVGVVAELDEAERILLEPQGILSIAAVPIRSGGILAGMVGFDDCREAGNWMPQTIQLLEAAAGGFGGAMARKVADDALREAHAILQIQAEELREHRRVATSLIEEARQAEQRAAAASEAKSTFLAVMSHEMRTPLNGIIGFTDLILSESPPDPIASHAAAIQSSGRILLGLINEVLDFSRIESGNVELEPVVADIREAASSALAGLRRAAERKGLVVELIVEDSVPHQLRLDVTRYQQILLNLVGNAVKFTDRGAVCVLIAVTRLDSDTVTLHTAVSDDGIGIEPDALERIFEPFGQADVSVHRRYGGTGLGLAISRNLCRLMGGDITAASRPGRGSTFTFRLAAGICSADTAIVALPGRVIPALAAEYPLNILIVDDVPTNRQLLCRLLEKMGYSPAVATHGEEALELTAARAFDLVLMDILMPGIDGRETTQRLRQREAGKGRWLRIIGLSADATPENARRCLDSGMDGFLTKPIQIDDLAAAIRRSHAEINGVELRRTGAAG